MIFRAKAFTGTSTLEMDADLPCKDLLAVKLDGHPLARALRPKTHRLLRYLLSNAGRVVRFDQLRSHVWGNEGATSNLIGRTLNELKAAVGKQWIELDEPAETCTLWASLSPSPADGGNAASCPIYTRNQIDQAIGSIDERLRDPIEELWLSGLDNTYVAVAQTAPLLDALHRGTKIKLMGVDPKSPARAMLDLIDPRYEANSLEKQVNKVTDTAREWRKYYPETFEYRLLPIVPALGFFIINPKLPSRQVKIEIYTMRPWKPPDSRPHFVIPEHMPEWREYFTVQFDNYWNLGNDPFK
jgi:hypothetical protein